MQIVDLANFTCTCQGHFNPCAHVYAACNAYLVSWLSSVLMWLLLLFMDEMWTQHLAGGGQPEAAADAKFTATLCCRVAREIKWQAERQVAGEEGRHGEGQDEEMRARREQEEGRAERRQAILRHSMEVAQGTGQQERLDAQPQGQRMRDGKSVTEAFAARMVHLYQSLEATSEGESRPAVEDVEKCFQVSTSFA